MESRGIYFIGTVGSMKVFLSELVKHYGNVKISEIPTIKFKEINTEQEFINMSRKWRGNKN